MEPTTQVTRMNINDQEQKIRKDIQTLTEKDLMEERRYTNKDFPEYKELNKEVKQRIGKDLK